MTGIDRREFLKYSSAAAVAAGTMGLIRPPLLMSMTQAKVGDRVEGLSASDSALLLDLERAMLLFFWEQADPKTGLIRQKAGSDGEKVTDHSSVAVVGFGLASLCIADHRKFLPSDQVEQRVLATLRTLCNAGENAHGFFYHYLEVETGKRAGNAEAGIGDMALCLGGVLTARQYFAKNKEIQDLATKIYERVDWNWMMDGGENFRLAWRPEKGFSKARWGAYSAVILGTLLGLGSPTHPLPASTWDAIKRPIYKDYEFRYIGSPSPLFVHQYPQGYFDLRTKRDKYANYFQNSMIATQVHKQWCESLKPKYPYFGADMWGITASNSEHGYAVWGGPPERGPVDGTLVPCAAGGSIPFLPHETVSTLRNMKEKYGAKVWKRYGFVDAFNPSTNWFSPLVLGIDVGITMLMAENALSGFVWDTFMKNPEAQKALDRAGFR
jgi:hypothetical protein